MAHTKTPHISSPPKGRYASQKRERPEEDSDDEDDEISSQDRDKRQREDSPIPQMHQSSQNDTNNPDGTSAQDEQFLNLLQDPYKRTVQQKICQAEIWANIFKKPSKHADSNTDNANNTGAKNRGSNKGTGSKGPLRMTKGGKEQHTMTT